MTQVFPVINSSALAPIHVITGPTGIGKTAVGLRLAEILDGEIVSADSRQIYRELTIGAAKPSKNDLARIPHHFIDELNLGQPYSAGYFAQQANDRIRQIIHRGRSPIIVGGSTLYLHALVHGLSPSPPSDPTVRQAIEKRLSQMGKDALYEQLVSVDPLSASTMDASKTARVVRALEVFELTQMPISSFHEKAVSPQYEYCVSVLTLDRSTLYQKIEHRVDQMVHDGLLDEIKHIRSLHLSPTLPALKSIGYQEPMGYLDGLYTWKKMIELIKRNSRRYAKRQLTWFRRYESYRPISIDDNQLEVIIDKILQ